jgi:hypothetical protein
MNNKNNYIYINNNGTNYNKPRLGFNYIIKLKT